MHPALQKLAERIEGEIRRDMDGDRLVWPSIPRLVVQIRKVLEKPDASVDEMTRAISGDPAVAAQLLKVANSVYYGTEPCRTLRAAVVRLGADALQNVVLMAVVSRVFAVGRRKQVQPLLLDLWAHSTLVGALSELLAERFDAVEPELAMLAGLVHDIGQVPVLLQLRNHPKAFDNPALRKPLVESLHARVGASVLSGWRLPAEISTVAGAHADIGAPRGGPVQLLDVVMAADIVAKLPGDREDVTAAAWRLPPLRRLGVSPGEMESLLGRADRRRAELDGLLAPRRVGT